MKKIWYVPRDRFLDPPPTILSILLDKKFLWHGLPPLVEGSIYLFKPWNKERFLTNPPCIVLKSVCVLTIFFPIPEILKLRLNDLFTIPPLPPPRLSNDTLTF